MDAASAEEDAPVARACTSLLLAALGPITSRADVRKHDKFAHSFVLECGVAVWGDAACRPAAGAAAAGGGGAGEPGCARALHEG